LCNAQNLAMTQTTPLIPSAEVCRRLGIDRSTLSRWVAAGKITPAMKLDGPRGAFLFTEAAIEALAKAVAA